MILGTLLYQVYGSKESYEIRVEEVRPSKSNFCQQLEDGNSGDGAREERKKEKSNDH